MEYVEFTNGMQSTTQTSTILTILLLIVACVGVLVTVYLMERTGMTRKLLFAVIVQVSIVLILFAVTIKTDLQESWESLPTISLNGEKFKVSDSEYRIYKLRYEDILKRNNGDKEKAYSAFLEEFLKNK